MLSLESASIIEYGTSTLTAVYGGPPQAADDAP